MSRALERAAKAARKLARKIRRHRDRMRHDVEYRETVTVVATAVMATCITFGPPGLAAAATIGGALYLDLFAHGQTETTGAAG